MSLKYIILNLLMLFMVLMVAVENYETWTKPIELPPASQETVRMPAPKDENTPMVVNKEPTSLGSFIVISEKNIFSPERKDFPILGAEKSNPTPRPQVILYGVTIAGDFQAASLSNPGRPLRKGERETMTLKLGERIGGYKLARIQPDRITMESNGDSFEVLLYDPKKPKKRTGVRTETEPTPMVTGTQPAGSPTSLPGSVPATPPVATPVTAPAAAPAAGSASELASGPPAAPHEKAPIVATVEKPKEQPQQQIALTPPAPALRPYFPPPSQRRGRRPVYSSSAPSGVLGQPPTEK